MYLQTPTSTSTTTTTTTSMIPNVQQSLTFSPLQSRRPIRLKNLINGEQTVDSLHMKYKANTLCDDNRCLASIYNQSENTHKARSTSDTLEQARDFVNNFYASLKRIDSPAHKSRLTEVEEDLKRTETYYLKETELIYGAKLAWRNAARCIGRIQWSKLQVFDARFTANANEMFEALCNHIKYATNKGKLRSAITIMPPRVKSSKNDWRIWNSQLIGYAGYKDAETGKVIGDQANVEITEIAQRLGWKGKGTRFDVLPLVLTANGGPPQVFPIPEEIVLRVKLSHPKHDWFKELELEWYALPAVANMMLDVGGLQFTAAPFSGWYMVTEIGTRDLGDPHRFNVLEEVAQKMGLNTASNMNLWKDQAVLELNIAVLYSFQKAGVTIVDHHTACETFMTHLANEQRLRGGCPADWVWLVPPTSGSLTPVFHQEMVNYHLLPNYEYMEPMWKTYDWSAHDAEQEKHARLEDRRGSLMAAAANAVVNTPKQPLISPSGRLIGTTTNGDLTPRKLRFKEIARAVKFTSKLFGKALSRRIKATILYATETGKSERYANKLAQIFSHAFNVHLMSMSDYDLTCLEHEALLLVVTSTFGNGDPPENGEMFSKHLAAVKMTGDATPDIDSINSVTTNPFFQMMSEDQTKDDSSSDGKDDDSEGDINKDNHQDKQEQQTHIRPLSNVRFGVFALGSTAYPHYCAFGRYVDQILGELGAERIMKCTCGDELCGQEKAFNEWSNQVFRKACEVFCLTDSVGPIDDHRETVWSPNDVKFVPIEVIGGQEKGEKKRDATKSSPIRCNSDSSVTTSLGTPRSIDLLNSQKAIIRNLTSITNKKIIPFSVKRRLDLHEYKPEENVETFCLDLETDRIVVPAARQLFSHQSSLPGKTQSSVLPSFEPGDHMAIYPVNNLTMVEKILTRMKDDISNDLINQNYKNFDFDQVNTILVKRENMDLTPATTVSTQAGPLDQSENQWIPYDRLPLTSMREALTRYLDITSPPNQEFLLILSRQTKDPEERKKLQQLARNFTTYEDWKNKTSPYLLGLLEEFKTIKFEPALITQIPLLKPRFYSVSGIAVSLTVGVVRFKTASGELREGLCSNYLNNVKTGSCVYGYIRSAPAFHMPQDKTIPMILICAGSGIAPFRSFWQQRHADMKSQQQCIMLGGSSATRAIRFGHMSIYFGCRNSDYILYRDELDEMYRLRVLSNVRVAFSRPKDYDVNEQVVDENLSSKNEAINAIHTGQNGYNQENGSNFKITNIRQARKKYYVQDKLVEDSDDVHRLIMLGGAHVYVCGDVAMAAGVYKTLVTIFNNHNSRGSTSEIDGEGILKNLRNENRYHEDIFGAKQAS